MTTIPIPPSPPVSPELARDNYLTYTRGFWSWLFTLDHKRIGVMYLCGVLGMFLVGGIFALLVRTQLLSPEGAVFSDNANYNRAFTLHGAIMVFLVIIPSVPAALGNFVLPIMLGAKDVAFPRLNLFSFWLWMAGAVFFILVLVNVNGGLDTGWTFYTPYSTTDGMAFGGVLWAVIGVFILGFSSIFTGMNFIVTIHRLRPPGMTWFRMPLFLWALYATALIQVLATPVLGITVALLFMERLFGMGFFNPALGGRSCSLPALLLVLLASSGVHHDSASHGHYQRVDLCS